MKLIIVLWTLIVFGSEDSRDIPKDAYGNISSRRGTIAKAVYHIVEEKEKFRIFSDSTTAYNFYKAMPSNTKEVYIYWLEEFK